MSKHAPKPYSVFSHLGYCPECGAREDPAKVKAQRDELLEALKEMLAVWEEDPAYGAAHAEKARAAIAKAEGGQE
jgi:hypothetical protein